MLQNSKPNCYNVRDCGQHRGQCPPRSGPWPVPKWLKAPNENKASVKFFKILLYSSIMPIKVTFTKAGEMALY